MAKPYGLTSAPGGEYRGPDTAKERGMIVENEPTTLRMWAMAIARTMEREGLDWAQAFEMAGLEPPGSADADARYPISGYTRLWQAAVELSGDPGFGLKVAEHAQPGTLHALGAAFLASETLDDVIDRIQRYSRIVTDAVVVRVRRSARRVTVCYTVPPHGYPIAYEAFDAFLGLTVKLGRVLPQREVDPLMVDLGRPRPPDTRPYQAWFRAPVRFGSAENRLHYDPALLREPLPAANPVLAQAMDRIIADYLARFDLSRFRLRVRSEILGLMPSGCPSLADVAASMNMSPRSLQRHLYVERSSYKVILEGVRRELACQYLRHSSLSLGDITHRLGFDDQSNFTRAFKRWIGTTPRRYRTRLTEDFHRV